MRILSIVSSFRPDGNTGRIASLMEEQLLKEASRQGVDLSIERITLGQKDIQICRGCRLCFDRGEDKCPLKDDLLSIRDKMLAADGYLIASPVYVEDVNGILKNWIDRLAFLCHRPALTGKRALLMVTSGGGASNHALRTMATALNAWGARVSTMAKFRAGALTAKEELQVKHEKPILQSAQTLLKDLMCGASFHPSWYSLIAFRIQQLYWSKPDHQAKSSYDYAYWKNKGWLEKGCTYYMPVKKRRWRVPAARLLAGGLAKIFV